MATQQQMNAAIEQFMNTPLSVAENRRISELLGKRVCSNPLCDTVMLHKKGLCMACELKADEEAEEAEKDEIAWGKGDFERDNMIHNRRFL